MTAGAFTFTDRAVPVVEIGIGGTEVAVTSVWDGAHWDNPDARWADETQGWRDVSCFVNRFDCEYGRARTLDRFQAGTATVLVDNTTGWADPTNAVTPGALSMRPGRPIRMGVDHTTLGVCWLFYGYIDVITPRYDPVDTDAVEIQCVDALGEVGRAKTKPLELPVGQGESATARIHRILDAAYWPTARRDVAPTFDQMIETDLGGQTADLLGQVADSCGGAVFADLAGTIVFRPADWQSYDVAAPPDGTIGNGGTVQDVVYGASDVVFGASDVVWGGGAAAAGAVCPVQWERPFDRADIATTVIMGRDADTAVQVWDASGLIRYGVEPYERTNLITQSDARILDLANRVLAVRNDDTAPRIRSVTLSAATAAESLDLQATVDPFLPSRYRCRLYADRGQVFDADHFATGVRHTVEPDEWETQIDLDVAAPYAVTNPGRWNSSNWDEAAWTDPLRRELTGVPS